MIHRNERKSLHRIWDTELLDCAGGDWSARAAEIDRTLTESRIASWLASGPVDWAEESWSLAHSHATFHLQGSQADLDPIAAGLLGTGIDRIRTALPG